MLVPSWGKMRAMTTRASTTGNYADINGLHVYYGRQGSASAIDVEWTDTGRDVSCTEEARLYCFEN